MSDEAREQAVQDLNRLKKELAATRNANKARETAESEAAAERTSAAELKVASLTTQLKSSDDAKEQAVKEVERLKKELDAVRNANTAREAAESEAAAERANAAESRAADLASQLKLSDEVREQAMTDVDRLKKELATAQNSLKASKSAASRAVQEAVSASGRRAQELVKELDATKEQLASSQVAQAELEAENTRTQNKANEFEILVSQLRRDVETAEQDAASKSHDKLDMEYMRREEDLRAEISDLVLELQEIRDDSAVKLEAAERRVSSFETQIEELESALSQSREENRALSQQSTAKRSDLAQETSELRKKLVEAQEIAATASGNTEAVKRRYEARLRDASELAEKQIISLTKELESAKRTIELAEKAKANAQQDAKKIADVVAEKEKEFERHLVTIREEGKTLNEEKDALASQIEQTRSECEEIKKEKEALEADLVETCSLLEKVSQKANESSDQYKQHIEELDASTSAMKEKLEAEILLAMDLAEEKEVLISEMETRQAELRAQVDTLKESSSMNSAKVSALEQKLKENNVGERERLQVLQTENKRLEKRLKDTWTALQGAHAVVEQTKAAAKEAVRKANSAAARAESAALKARQELSEAQEDAKSHANIPLTSGSPVKPVSQSQSQSTSARSTPVRRRGANVGLDNEMQRANDLLSRISRSRESSVKDDESFGRGGGNSDNGNTAVFGYRGAQ